MILSTLANPSLVRDKQENPRSLSYLNTSSGVPHVHKRGCGMQQVFTAVLVSLLWNVTPCTFVSRHQCLLGLATLKMEVGSSFEASVPVYRSALHRVPGNGDSHSSVTTGPALDS
jgi:hypothetical protein